MKPHLYSRWNTYSGYVEGQVPNELVVGNICWVSQPTPQRRHNLMMKVSERVTFLSFVKEYFIHYGMLSLHSQSVGHKPSQSLTLISKY